MWRGEKGTRHVTAQSGPSRTACHPRVGSLASAPSTFLRPFAVLRPATSVFSLSSPTMSSLRRFAQTNAAVSASPRAGSQSSASVGAGPTTPVQGSGATTPRTRLIYPISPVTSPSLSASQPFDWDAARLRRPPPYATPGKRKTRTSDFGTPLKGTPSKRVVRKKSLYER